MAGDGLATITLVSAPEWNAGGHRSVHSTAVDICDIPITGRWALRASHRMKMKYRSLITESMAPYEDITCHLV